MKSYLFFDLFFADHQHSHFHRHAPHRSSAERHSGHLQCYRAKKVCHKLATSGSTVVAGNNSSSISNNLQQYSTPGSFKPEVDQQPSTLNLPATQQHHRNSTGSLKNSKIFTYKTYFRALKVTLYAALPTWQS